MMKSRRSALQTVVAIRRFSSAPPIIDGNLLFSKNSSDFTLVSSDIARACGEWGFFQLINHRVPQKSYIRMVQSMKEFFALPLESKMKVKRSQDNARGFFNDEFTKQKIDWKEGFDFGAKPFPHLDDLDESNRCQDGFNLFPENELEIKQNLDNYFEDVTKLSVLLNEAMAVGLGLPRDYFVEHFDKHSSFLRLNYYPICQNPSQHLGISPHHDAGWLTVLYADPDVRSLQVSRNDEWYTVEPIEGAFIINTGDMAQVWSNDRYIAPTHRVLANKSEVRYSAPFFFNPNYSTDVAPLDVCITPENPSYYRPINWGAFRNLRFQGDYSDVGEENQIHHYRFDGQKCDVNR